MSSPRTDRLTAAFAALSEEHWMPIAARESKVGSGYYLGRMIGFLAGTDRLGADALTADENEIRACVRAAAERRAKP